MTNINQTVKAVRALIHVGDTSIECFRLPTGHYEYGIEALAQIAGKDKKILSDKKSPYLLKALLGGDKTSQSVKVEGIGYTYKTITQVQLGVALAALARMGHTEALAILTASFEESLERRADAAFAVERTEEERNTAFTSRVEMVKHWAVEHIEASKQAGQWLPRKWHPEATNAENLLKDKLIEIAQMKDNIAFIRRQNKNKPLDHDAQRKLVIIAQLEDEVEAQGVSC